MDKVAVVTGGSGAVGAATVRVLLEQGWRVAFLWNTNAEIAGQLAKETGASAYQADLTRSNQTEAAIQAVLKDFGQIDALVNNAGLTQVLPFAMIEEEDWDEVLAANLKSMFLVTREVVRGMILRKAGRIVNVGSLAGHRLLQVPVHYATAKAGVTGFTLSLAKELSRYHIRVNEVVPGLLNSGVGSMVPEKELTEYVQYCTAGRTGEPEEVARVIAFLLSDAASYINAQSIPVNGGL